MDIAFKKNRFSMEFQLKKKSKKAITTEQSSFFLKTFDRNHSWSVPLMVQLPNIMWNNPTWVSDQHYLD
jgi:hypothetical protein